MKREAVQEERQRGSKLQPKQEPNSVGGDGGGGGGCVGIGGVGGNVGGVGSVGSSSVGGGGGGEDVNPTSSVRDLTIDRIRDAEEMSEKGSGDNAIPYLKVGVNSCVPPEYKVKRPHLNHCANLNIILFPRVPFHIYVKWSTSSCINSSIMHDGCLTLSNCNAKIRSH